MSSSIVRVLPFVEDRRNCLLFEPKVFLDEKQMASFQSAFKNAIQVVFQLEENELAAEPLPASDDRRLILFYESAEGCAGVLRRFLDDTRMVAIVAEEALRICHFNGIKLKPNAWKIKGIGSSVFIIGITGMILSQNIPHCLEKMSLMFIDRAFK